jgi:transcriptional regulator GlxA family with amidase domain
MGEKTSSTNEDSRISFALNYMKEHLTEKISIDKLVAKTSLSKSYFFKVFKNTLGVSPVDYLLMERIKFAKELIKTTNYQVAEIAYKSGFSSPSYFSKQFKRIEKISPGHFKKLFSQASFL